MRKLGPDEIESKRTKEVMPLFKLGEKSDIAFAALYLASNAGNYVNRTTLIVDGGQWSSRPSHMAKDEVKMISRLVEKCTRAAPSSKL
ncbi:Glucose/ribitol dehydrogenase [Artemisia annua]|uniref:Glucose/ribitol dehydrogenase n=1 Tax=Artemisia annua TaxID=35608 RepID=A0A2U1LH15_ARTAN|nr:Glucose/ribitol dehydrogenase [Artemisia annua]